MSTDTVLKDETIEDLAWENRMENSRAEIPAEVFFFARAIEQAVLQSYESQLLRLLVDIRFAAGDDGKRMQDELVEYIGALRRDAERWRCARDLLSVDDIETAVENMRGFTPDPDESAKADAAIDAAMEKQP